MSEKSRLMSLSAIGLDSPGLVSKITTRVHRLNGNILDVEENCRRGLFSIFLAIDFSASDQSLDQIRTSLKDIEEETGLKVILKEVDDPARPEPNVGEPLRVTILGMDRPGIIAQVSTLFHHYEANIESCRMIARGTFFSMEMAIATEGIRTERGESHELALERMKEELRELCARLNQSVVVQSESTYRQAKKIVVFDVESCLIQEESAQRFMEAINEHLYPQGRRIEPSMDPGAWAQALADRVVDLEGVPLAVLESAGEILQWHEGAPELLHILKSMGYKVALLSTGFSCFLNRIYEFEEVDYAFCNTLCADENGCVTGELEEPVLTPVTKNEILEFIMNMEDIRREQVVAVGDGSARSRYMNDVGLSIAYKPGERPLPTDGIFSSDHMLNILYCLGIPEEDIARYQVEREAPRNPSP